MTKAVLVKINQTAFLAETDQSVELPIDFEVAASKRLHEPGDDFLNVVNLKGVKQEFSEIKQLIIACGVDLYEAISSIPTPDKVAVEFGIKLVGETGFPMITKAVGEANFKITIEWKSEG